jgi:hypothetical protein
MRPAISRDGSENVPLHEAAPRPPLYEAGYLQRGSKKLPVDKARYLGLGHSSDGGVGLQVLPHRDGLPHAVKLGAIT